MLPLAFAQDHKKHLGHGIHLNFYVTSVRLPEALFNECSASLKQLMITEQITSFGVKFSVYQCKFNGFLLFNNDCVMLLSLKNPSSFMTSMSIGIFLSRMSQMCETKQKEQTGITSTTSDQIRFIECKRSMYLHKDCMFDICARKLLKSYTFKG